MSSPDLDVRHVARLARIALAEEEVKTFQDQLGRVLEHIALALAPRTANNLIIVPKVVE